MKYIKPLLSLFVIILISITIILLSNKKTPIVNSIVGREITLDLKEKRIVFDTRNQLKLQFIESIDSRCPENLMCIREGDIVIELKVNSETKYFRLGDAFGSTGNKYSETAKFDNYKITLLEASYHTKKIWQQEEKPYIVIRIDKE
jgi:hypothetical protein